MSRASGGTNPAFNPSSPYRSYVARFFASLNTSYASLTSLNRSASPFARSGCHRSAAFLYALVVARRRQSTDTDSFIHSFIHSFIRIHSHSFAPLQRVRIVRILSRHAERVVHRSSRFFRHPVTPRSRSSRSSRSSRGRTFASRCVDDSERWAPGWVGAHFERKRASGRNVSERNARTRERIRDDFVCGTMSLCVRACRTVRVRESRRLRGGVAENAADELHL